MKKRSQAQWRDLLPAVYSWIGRTDISTSAELVPGAHHIVSVQSQSTPEKFELDVSGLSADLCQMIKDQCAQLGWRPQAGPVLISVQSLSLLLVPITSLNVSQAQKGRQLGTEAAFVLRNLCVESLVICAGAQLSSFDIWEGLVQSFYNLESFKDVGEAKCSLPKQVSFLGANVQPEVEKKYRVMAEAGVLMRMISDAPPNWLNSEKFAEIASDMAKDLGITCEVRGRSEIEALGMGSFASVAKGTSVDPKLIVLEIKGKDPSKTVALLGKGLTFDSGGLSLKSASGMEQMKYDMAGGAAVLGAAYVLGQIQPPTNVVCIIGAVENMPFNGATRPGDIVKAMNGKSIEIMNTDAEGRLVLADLLHYTVKRYKPEFMVDAATLTGAVIIALGHAGAGLFANSQPLAKHLLSVSEKVGEPLWQLPMWPELDKDLKSTVANYKNTSADSTGAKASVAGAFLKAFVGDTKWAHLDIAGTAWDCRALGFPTVGASTFGLRTMVQACLDFQSL